MTENMAFEKAIIKLEEIVKALEKGTTPLDESLKLFEEGTSLVRLCNSQLDNVEQKIKILIKNKDGEHEEKDFVKKVDETK